MRNSLTRRRVQRIAAASVSTAAVAALVAATAPAAQAAHGSDRAAGARTVAPIIGGTEVSSGAYPFMVAVLAKGRGSAYDRQFCGGSLVDPDVVMTAAHCLAGENPKNLQVAVGRTVLSDSGQGQVRNAADAVVHPRYLKGDQAYDVGFILLSKPVEGIAPIKLPTKGTDGLIRPGQKARVIGWGNTDTELPNHPDRLRKVDVPILAHSECKISYPEYNRKVNVCAGVEGRDSCQGDSGGPMFRTVPGRQETYQVGIVSYGEGCAAQGAPGVYTSTSSAPLWDTLDESAKGKRIKRALNR